jgi:hypothetical protein
MNFKSLTDNAMNICMKVFKDETLISYMRGEVSFDVVGIFDTGLKEVDPDLNIPVISNKATLKVQKSKMPVYPAKGDRLEINEKKYRVFEVEPPDSFGCIVLILEVVKV